MGLDDYRDVAFFDDVAHFAPDLGDVPNHAVGYTRQRSLMIGVAIVPSTGHPGGRPASSAAPRREP